MIENPKWKRCEIRWLPFNSQNRIHSIQVRIARIKSARKEIEDVKKRYGGEIPKGHHARLNRNMIIKEMTDLKSTVFHPIQAMWLSNAPEGYGAFAWNNGEGFTYLITTPSNPFPTEENLFEALDKDNLLIGNAKKMGLAKQYAVEKLNNIFSQKQLDKKDEKQLRQDIFLRRMGRKIEKKKGINFSIFTEGDFVEVVASGDFIAATKCLKFVKRNGHWLSFRTERSFYDWDSFDPFLLMLYDYFYILSKTQLLTDGQQFYYNSNFNEGERSIIFERKPKPFGEEIKFENIRWDDFNLNLRYILECFSLWSKEQETDIFAVPQYIKTMLEKRRDKTVKEDDKKGFYLFNNYIPPHICRTGFRERGNRSNPSAIEIKKGTQVLYKIAPKFKRNSRIVNDLQFTSFIAPLLKNGQGKENPKELDLTIYNQLKEIEEGVQKVVKEFLPKFKTENYYDVIGDFLKEIFDVAFRTTDMVDLVDGGQITTYQKGKYYNYRPHPAHVFGLYGNNKEIQNYMTFWNKETYSWEWTNLEESEKWDFNPYD